VPHKTNYFCQKVTQNASQRSVSRYEKVRCGNSTGKILAGTTLNGELKILSERESTMRCSRTFVWLSMLVSGVFNVFGQANDPPQLPGQYAEAVLQVEGMI
jgi:hypothetical protein